MRRLPCQITPALRLAVCLLAAAFLIACTGAATDQAQAAFPGLNGKIVYDSGRQTCCDLEVMVMKPDGSGHTQLTFKPDSAFPAWSPDGRKIAFASTRDGHFQV